MKVDFTFLHVDSSDALKSYTIDRLDKITRFEMNPMDVQFTISSLRHECSVTVSLCEGRRKYKAEATSDDFYRAIDMVVNKLWRQLSKEKRRIKGHKNPEKSVYGKISRLNEQLESDFTTEFPNRKVS